MKTCLLIFVLGLAFPLLSGNKIVWEEHSFKADTSEEQVTAQRGRMTVKENRERSDSRDIELGFIRFKSTAAKPGSPIVYLAGGPGGSGSFTARGSRFGLFMKMREAGDVIAFDQRGTGLSTRIEPCDKSWSYPNDQPLARAKLIAFQEENARACNAFWKEKGVDLNGYNTLESARDLDALRRALGVEKISLWGISYGSHLGLAYARYFPDHLDKLLLAGIEGPDHTIKLPRDTQNLMEAIDVMAAREGFHFLDNVQTVLNRLEREPATIEMVDPRLGTALKLTIGKFDVQMATSGYLRGPDSFKVLPTFFQAMAGGDFSVMAARLMDGRSGRIRGMSAAMDGASYASPQRLAAIAEQEKSTVLGGAINYPGYATFARGLDINDLGSVFRGPLRSSAPTLFISGTLDGRTSVNNALELLPDFSNAHHLIIEGAGHSDPLFLSSPEIADIMLRFMRGGDMEDRRIVLPPISFKLRKSISLSTEQLARYVGTYQLEKGADIVIAAGTDHLIVDVTGMGIFKFYPSSAQEFFMREAEVTMAFTLDKTGGVERIEVNIQGAVMKAKPREVLP